MGEEGLHTGVCVGGLGFTQVGAEGCTQVGVDFHLPYGLTDSDSCLECCSPAGG